MIRIAHTLQNTTMLNIIEVRQTRPKEKPFQLSDGNGLFLRIMPNGKRKWIFNRSVNGQHVSKQLGEFPQLSLKDARDMAAQLYLDMKNTTVKKSGTFSSIFSEWMMLKQTEIKNWKDIVLRFEKYILPVFGDKQYKTITQMEIITTLKTDLGKRGKLETIKRICGNLKEMELYAFNCGLVDSLRFQSLSAVFPAPSTKLRNRPSIPYSQLSEVLPQLQVAGLKARATWEVLLCGFFTLLRPGEYCQMKWEWVDFENRIIQVPAEVMKMKRPHTVPISTQLMVLLQNRPRVSEYVFPATQGKQNQPFSENATSLFLRRHGMQGRLVPHGIRAIGRSWMFDNGIDFDVAELCLAHTIGNQTVRAYLRSDRLDERRTAMQSWCDFVEQCLKG